MVTRFHIEQSIALAKLSRLAFMQSFTSSALAQLLIQICSHGRPNADRTMYLWHLDMMAKGVLMIVLLTSPSRAEEIFIDDMQSLDLIRGVELVVTDDVTDDCWTNASLAKQKIRSALEQSQIHVCDESFVITHSFPYYIFMLSDLRWEVFVSERRTL